MSFGDGAAMEAVTVFSIAGCSLVFSGLLALVLRGTKKLEPKPIKILNQPRQAPKKAPRRWRGGPRRDDRGISISGRIRLRLAADPDSTFTANDISVAIGISKKQAAQTLSWLFRNGEISRLSTNRYRCKQERS